MKEYYKISFTGDIMCERPLLSASRSDKKYDFDKDEEIKSAIEKLNKEFDGNGRVLIRASGTEPLVRVMIEGEDQDYIKQKAQTIASLIEQKLGDEVKK